MAALNRINDAIYKAAAGSFEAMPGKSDDGKDDLDASGKNNVEQEDPKTDETNESDNDETITHRGRMLLDATAWPQDIAYRTDLKLLN
jgi:hypothetical protein